MKPRDPAWKPVEYGAADIEAVQAVAAGVANEGQQKRALDWIINTVAGTYELSFRSDADGGDRETAFSEGRRFVGMQVVKAVNMSPQILAELRKKNG